jgi:anti-sigma regulatory factor (Ser/Thr protein kinase)
MMHAPKDAVREDDRPVLDLELERNTEAPSLARAAISGFCQDRDLSPSTLATIMLLVSEVVTNAVIHPPVEPPGTIGIHAARGEGVIRIEVTDPGSGFTPKHRDPDLAGGGYGLYLLEKESARWGVKPAPRTVVWFEVAA